MFEILETFGFSVAHITVSPRAVHAGADAFRADASRFIAWPFR
jgi:hypothetical protein